MYHRLLQALKQGSAAVQRLPLTVSACETQRALLQ